MPILRLRELSIAGLLSLLGAGCATDGPAPVVDPGPPAPAPEEVRAATLNRILTLEDRRVDGGGELQRLALSPDPLVRARATRALGRLPFPERGEAVSTALLRALADSDPEVRCLAAFGLGLRADPGTSAGLLAAWKDPNPAVRARLVEAGSRFEDPDLREEVMYALADPSPLVRAEAANAPHRWDAKSGAAAVVDIALRNVAAKAPEALRRERWGPGAPDGEGAVPEDPIVVRAALFSLARRGSSYGESVFLLWCRATDDPLARVFATQGLASLDAASESVLEALRECAGDEDWRVVVEAARGLGKSPHPASVPALERALKHPSAGVRATVAEALGTFGAQRLQVEPLLERCLVDVSPTVKAGAVVSLTRLFGEEIAADLEARALDGEPLVRKAVAASCEFLPASAALPLLLNLTRDGDKSVAFTAAQGLGNFLDAGGRARAHELLASEDNGLRLAAVLAIQKSPVAADLVPLLECYKTSTGDIADEIQFEILNAAVELPDNRAADLLSPGLRSPSAYTRALAREHMQRRGLTTTATDPRPLAPSSGEVPAVDFEARNPRVEVHTTRGTMLFELFPQEAPLHVHNFLTLARAGAYDGLDFHRVVPDFVIQGGDYRGDGNGGETWRGAPMRHEFNERKYVEGSLGMPRNADPESGGSQFFVTHRPTPHLDGRYTLFGQLRQGEGVLRQIEPRDRIQSVSVRGE